MAPPRRKGPNTKGKVRAELSLGDLFLTKLRDSCLGLLRGRSRGHVRGRVANRGFVTGNRSRPYNENNNQSFSPRTVRGRGLRQYPALTRGKSDAPPSQSKYLSYSNPDEFALAMAKLVQDTELARSMGDQARQHVVKSFSTKVFWQHPNQYDVVVAGEKSD